MSKPHDAVAKKSSLRWIPLADLQIDPEAQRRFSVGWVKARVAIFDPEKLGFIVVNRRTNGKVYAIDGQHRAALMRAVGWSDQQIQCEYYEGLTQREEALVFLARNDRKAVQPFDKFRVAVTGGVTEPCDIDRIVRAQNLVLDVEQKDGHINAVSALEYIYRGGGVTSAKEAPAALARTLKTVQGAWGRQSSSFIGKILEGVGLVQLRYDGKLDQDALSKKLALVSGGAPGILARAKNLKDIKGRPMNHCVAAVVVDVYNQGRRKGKVEDWWQ